MTITHTDHGDETHGHVDGKLAVWRSPGRCSGRWCVSGTRLTASTIYTLRRDGLPVANIAELYPSVSRVLLDRTLDWLANGGATLVEAEIEADVLDELDGDWQTQRDDMVELRHAVGEVHSPTRGTLSTPASALYVIETLREENEKLREAGIELADEAHMLRARCNVMAGADSNGRWIWTGEDDELESMGNHMVVQITAGQLRDLLANPAIESVIKVADQVDDEGVSYSVEALLFMAAASFGLRVDGNDLIAHVGSASLVKQKGRLPIPDGVNVDDGLILTTTHFDAKYIKDEATPLPVVEPLAVLGGARVLTIGMRVLHRSQDLFGKLVEIDDDDQAWVKYEWPVDPKAEPRRVPLAELEPAAGVRPDGTRD